MKKKLDCFEYDLGIEYLDNRPKPEKAEVVKIHPNDHGYIELLLTSTDDFWDNLIKLETITYKVKW